MAACTTGSRIKMLTVKTRGKRLCRFAVRERSTEALFEWARRHHSRITVSPERAEAMLVSREPHRIVIGFRDETEDEAEGPQVWRVDLV